MVIGCREIAPGWLVYFMLSLIYLHPATFITCIQLRSFRLPPWTRDSLDSVAMDGVQHRSLAVDTAEIRLLELSPEERTSESIACKLHVVPLDDAPVYTAISYVWGESTNCRTILLNGAPFLVRLNLWDFLIQEQKHEKHDLLWLDAICIDQNSIAERSHQVAIMGRIFSSASSVIAWLGSGPQSIRKAISQLEKCDIENTELSAGYVQALQASKYWRRIWIIQEYVLAKTVKIQCGARQTSDDRIRHVFGTLDKLRRKRARLDYADIPLLLSTSPMAQIMRHRWLLHAQQIQLQGHSFQNTFRQFSLGECSDKRDRVYALLALVSPADAAAFPIIPDYSLTPLELFVSLVNRRRDQFSPAADDCLVWRLLIWETLHMAKQLEVNTVDEKVDILISGLYAAELTTRNAIMVGKHGRAVGGKLGAQILQVHFAMDDRMRDEAVRKMVGEVSKIIDAGGDLIEPSERLIALE